MTLAEQFETLRAEADRLELLQTDVLYRRKDNKPSMKKRIKIVDGVAQEVMEDKPIKSVHLIYFTPDLVLRVKKSNFERKGHLEALGKRIEELGLTDLLYIFKQMTGDERGKNIYWNLAGDGQPTTYLNVTSYLQKCKEDAENERIAAQGAQLFKERPAIGDDLVLLEGW